MPRAAIVLTAAGLAASVAAPVVAQTTPHGAMVRYPDVSRDSIVFVYANDLWVVPKDGGTARPLASPPGMEVNPKFSPDGQTIAFQGNYDGDRDIYTVPTTGGPAYRITHHPANELVSGWTPDGRILFNQNGLSGLGRQQEIFTVSPDGGLAEKLPVPYGAAGAMSPDGEWIAFTPMNRDTRTWKRYKGGMASDIWLLNVNTLESRQITDWDGTDTIPMWAGDKVYYLSDAGAEAKLNIWEYDVGSGRRSQVTDFSEYDVKFPSIGPGDNGQGEIVFQYGSSLMLLDLATERAVEVDITIPGDRPNLRKQTIDASDFLAAGGAGATGKRVVVEARGDIWTAPAENGTPRQITNTAGAAERMPAWSPDGKWICYFSDEDGEYELYVVQSDGKGEVRQLTDGNKTYFMSPNWSPDSETIAYTDKAGNLYLTTLEDGATEIIDRDEWGNPMSVDWSRDSRWLTYAKQEERSVTSAVYIYDTEEGSLHKVTSGFFADSSPAFGGDFLYYVSARDFTGPSYEDVGSTFIYDETQKIIAVPLTEEVEHPFAPDFDDETWEDEEEDTDEEAAEEGDDDAADAADEDDGPTSPIHGVWAGTATGAAQMGAPSDEIDIRFSFFVDEEGNVSLTTTSMGETSSYDSCTFDEGSMKFEATRSEGGITIKLEGTVSGDELTGTWSVPDMGINGGFSASKTDEEVEESEGGSDEGPVEIDLAGFESRGIELPISSGNYGMLDSNDKGHLLYMSFSGGAPALKIFDIEADDPAEKNVVAGIGFYDVSGDGKKALVFGAGGASVISTSAGQSLGKTIDTSNMRKRVDPRAEWGQIFTDAWRRQRDFFYVENLHGVDWDGIYDQYKAMLAEATSREDVGFIIGEMISELNIGHAYYGGGDTEDQPSENVGMLGVNWEVGTEVDEGGSPVSAYRIAEIITGAPWDSDARGPLSQPGIGVSAGTYVLAVNGMPIETDQDPWAPFVGLAGDVVSLTVADALIGDDEARNERDIVVELMGAGREAQLRYRHWVETNRTYVHEASSGRVGYIHVPDTGINGQNELFRQFYGQAGKDAMLIDDRWNGGGQIPTRFIELLNRPRTNYWYRRDGKDWPWPYDSHQGPKAMLINGAAGSGGDMFPWLFRYNDLGPLIGMRTWGGLVGISGVPGLIDNAVVTVPNFGFYETDGTWGVEGYGVAPDIEVIDDPGQLARGIDPQIDAAIEYLLNEVEANGYEPPRRPTEPDRSGIGIPASDR
ncbi:MAG: S41 family peptidase [Planctomycetota bacterium]